MNISRITTSVGFSISVITMVYTVYVIIGADVEKSKLDNEINISLGLNNISKIREQSEINASKIEELEVGFSDKLELLSPQVKHIDEQQELLTLYVTAQNMQEPLKNELMEIIERRLELKLEEKLGVTSLENRIQIIETSILANPEKVLQVPMLVKDMAVIDADVQDIEKKITDIDSKIDDVEKYQIKINVLESQLADIKSWASNILIGLFLAIFSLFGSKYIDSRKKTS